MRRSGIARNAFVVGLAWLLAVSTGCSPDAGAGASGGSGATGAADGALVVGGGGGTSLGGAGPSGGVIGAGGGVIGAGGFGGSVALGGAGSGGAPFGSGGFGGALGGAPGAGGVTALGGASGQCNAQVLDPSTMPACTTCTGGRCVTTTDFPGAPTDLLDSCGAGSVCMPDVIVATKGNVLLPQCTSVSGAEGRCASLCIPVVRSLETVLPQSSCGADDRCAPCFNPSDGSSTGICNVGCDPGPTAAPVLFPQCCTGRGRCVPRDVIPGAAAANLPQETCSSSSDVCVPSDIIKDPTYKFPSCTVPIALNPNAPGVCVPDCIVNAVKYGNLVGQGTCASPTDKCAPCTNPLDNTPTGACP